MLHTTLRVPSIAIRVPCMLALLAFAACIPPESEAALDYQDDTATLTFGKADEGAGPARAHIELARPAELMFMHSADCGSRCDLLLRYTPTQIDYLRGSAGKLEAQLSRWNGQRFENVSGEGPELSAGEWRLTTRLDLGREGGVVFRDLPPGRYRVTTEVETESGSAIRGIALDAIAEQHAARSVLGCVFGQGCSAYCPGTPAFCGHAAECVDGQCLPLECKGTPGANRRADLRGACETATSITLAAPERPEPETDVLESRARPSLTSTAPISCWSFIWRDAKDIEREMLSVVFDGQTESPFDGTGTAFEVSLYPSWGDCRNGAAIPSTRIFGEQSHRTQLTRTHLAVLEPTANSDRTMFVCAERTAGLTCDAASEQVGDLSISVVRKSQNWERFLERTKLTPWDQGPPAALFDDERLWF